MRGAKPRNFERAGRFRAWVLSDGSTVFAIRRHPWVLFPEGLQRVFGRSSRASHLMGLAGVVSRGPAHRPSFGFTFANQHYGEPGSACLKRSSAPEK